MGEELIRVDEEVDGIMLVLTRRPLQPGQRLVLRMLWDAHGDWVSASELMQKSEELGIGKIKSALSALSRRVGATYDLPDALRERGLELLLEVQDGSPNSYRLTSSARLLLEQKPHLLTKDA